VTRGGVLPDVAAFARAVRRVGDQFTLRGVEITARGELTEAGGRAMVRLTGTGELLALAPLLRKVQWDAVSRREAAASAEERGACARLLRERRAGVVRVTGPLAGEPGQAPVLEVREFAWE